MGSHLLAIMTLCMCYEIDSELIVFVNSHHSTVLPSSISPETG